MSDTGRKDFTTKASESLQPDSTKSTMDKMGETITDAGDKMTRGLQSDDSKSTTQSMGDKMGRSKDEAVHGGTSDSIMDKAKNTLGMGGNQGTGNTKQ